MAAVSVSSRRISNLGEGPFWDEKNQTLLYVDLYAGDVCSLDPITQETEAIHFDGATSLVVPYSSDNNLRLITLNREVVTLNWNTGERKKVAEVENDDKLTRFNDGKCDESGILWAGTMYAEAVPLAERSNLGSLYSIDGNSSVKSHLSDIGISNGIAWTKDSRIMFYVDSQCRKIFAFDFDVSQTVISNQRTVLDYNQSLSCAEFGLPDGMTMDEEEKLWVACFGGSRILRVDPETGKILEIIHLPTKNITSCCFGGKNYETLYVTSAWRGLTENEMKNQPDAGKVFQVKELNVKGLPQNKFRG